MCNEIKELGIDIFITSNGVYVKLGSDVIPKVPLDSGILQEVMEYARIKKHALSFYTEELNMTEVRDSRVLSSLKETLTLHDYRDQSINSPVGSFSAGEFVDEEKVKTYIYRFPHLSFNRWHPYIVNVLEQEVSKSAAIKSVVNVLWNRFIRSDCFWGWRQ